MRLSRKIVSVAAASAALSFAVAVAQTSSPVIDHVEEDWQLVVATPDPVGVGPQITTCMSPVSDNSSAFVAFDMNYREYPSFSAGGMQLQVWSSNSNSVLSTNSSGKNVFSTPNETITWTQVMTNSSGSVTCTVTNGNSITWGKFAQGTAFNVTFQTAAADMSGYSPTVSAAQSGVSWEANLVTSLKLVQVRYYSGTTLISTDTTTRTISLGN